MGSGLVFGFVHAAVILAVSFFVLVSAVKNNSPALKAFGVAIAVLLWISAALIFAKGLTSSNFVKNKMCLNSKKGCASMMGSNMQMNEKMPGK